MTLDKSTDNYDADSIKILEGLEAVRKRPSMYIGSTSSVGLHHLVWEAVDNSVDEAQAGFCDRIDVTIHSDNSISVKDNGRGIPVEFHESGVSALEVVMTTLHAGGKFDNDAYKTSGGLHGVGISVVNALSELLQVEICRSGKIHVQEFSRGEPITKQEIKGKTELSGTKIRFKPDTEIFEVIKFNFETLSGRLRELAYLNNGLTITLSDKREGKEENQIKYCFDGGLISYVKYLNENKAVLHDEPVWFSQEVELEEEGTIKIEVSLQYNTGYQEEIFSFVNNINTKDGGTHLTGFKTALTRSLNDYAAKHKLLKKSEDSFNGNDVREGLAALISIKIPDPQFEGQTKTRLGNRSVAGAVSSHVSRKLNTFLEENPSTGKKIIQKCLLTSAARQAAKKARDLTRRKSALESAALPGKLADCTVRDPAQAELFIVEGNSAGGSAKQGRDRYFQAILPLRGKIINVEKAPLNRILSNNEIRTIITATGTGIGEDYEEENIRYQKVIIMTDADVDGAHIRTLLLTFFYRHMPKLIENGYLYIAQPPLFQVKKGKKEEYAFSEKEKDRLVSEFGEDKVTIQRYKGLGEMNADQLWVTTMEPKNRKLLRVQIENAMEAATIFTKLMGSEVEPRRLFIQKHAAEVRNLDV